jgi:DNA mismatch repair protein MutS
LILDAATLGDLDILSTSTPHGPTLLGLVDRTRTRAGQRHLRRRLTTLADSDEAIVALQRAHQLLAARASAYGALVDQADSEGAERYLNSNWQLPDAKSRLSRFTERLWRPHWYRQYWTETAMGQARVVALLRTALELGGMLAAADATVLRDVGLRIATLIETQDAQELLRLGASRSVVAHQAFDQVARGRARPLLADVIDCIGIVDAMLSLSIATIEHGWSYPRPGSGFKATGLVHPFIKDQAVPNDVHFDERVRVCFVTGPNMAGKSTFLKAIAIAVLLAHAGCGVPAASMEFRTVRTIFSSVNIVDNLSGGESFYLAEVRRIRSLAVALDDHGSALAVVDEPFRGTNVHDAAEATLAVITRLASHRAALVFIASHLGEVVPAIVDNPGICLMHFAADVTGGRPRFDYQLRKGMSAQRLGMTLLRQEEVLELLERSARSSHERLSNGG